MNQENSPTLSRKNLSVWNDLKPRKIKSTVEDAR